MTDTTVNASLLRTGANGKLILNGNATLTNAHVAMGDTGREVPMRPAQNLVFYLD
jgi:hypothetical protein